MVANPDPGDTDLWRLHRDLTARLAAEPPRSAD